MIYLVIILLIILVGLLATSLVCLCMVAHRADKYAGYNEDAQYVKGNQYE